MLYRNVIHVTKLFPIIIYLTFTACNKDLEKKNISITYVITGVVKDKKTEVPLSNVNVGLCSSNYYPADIELDTSKVLCKTKTDLNGNYRFEIIDNTQDPKFFPNTSFVFSWNDGYCFGSYSSLVKENSQWVGNIFLSRLLFVTGVVSDQNTHLPVPGATVALFYSLDFPAVVHLDTNNRDRQITDESGKFKFEVVETFDNFGVWQYVYCWSKGYNTIPYSGLRKISDNSWVGDLVLYNIYRGHLNLHITRDTMLNSIDSALFYIGKEPYSSVNPYYRYLYKLKCVGREYDSTHIYRNLIAGNKYYVDVFFGELKRESDALYEIVIQQDMDNHLDLYY